MDENWSELKQIVDEQAEDEGLWFITPTASEAYLQDALRRLHGEIKQRSLGGTQRRCCNCGSTNFEYDGTCRDC